MGSAKNDFVNLRAQDALGAMALVYPVSSGPLTTGYVVTVQADGTLAFAAATGGGGVSDGDKGDIVVSSSGAVWTIDTNVVGDTKLRQGVGTSVIGRASGTTGNVADIAAGADGKFLARRSGALTFDTLVAGDVPSLDASKITTGTLALARGGTNADLSASGGTTKILAQDASHVVSARDLVAADIPSLDAAIIATGTLAVARGGTNLGSYATGDLLYASAGTTLAKLAIGGTGKILTVSSGLPAWVDATGSGGGGVLPPWVAYSRDTKPGSAGSADDEFDSSSLDGSWAETIGGSPTHDIDTTWRSHYYAKWTANSQSAKINKAFTPGGDMQLTARIKYGHGSSFSTTSEIDIYVSDSNGTTVANGIGFQITKAAGANVWNANFLSRDSSVTTARGTIALGPRTSLVIHIQRVSNTWTVWFSDDGYAFIQIVNFSKTFTVAGILIQMLGPSSNWNTAEQDQAGVDWIRSGFLTV